MEKINILGVNVANITKAEVLNKIEEYLRDEKQHFIVTPNPEIILEAVGEDEELWYILNHADISLADGIALKFAAWFYGKNLKRIAGADLVIDILKLAAEKRHKVAIFNWSGGLSSSQEIKSTINAKFPGLEVYAQAIDRQAQVDFSKINQLAPDIVFCGLGAPYQEKFIYHNLAKIASAKLAMAVGGSFDFLTGRVRRAPFALRRLGLEWLWRLMKQPKRWRRIYRATIIFSFRFFIFFFVLRLRYRPNVACLLYKKERAAGGPMKYKILIVERIGERGHWQLPQGGTDGQDLRVAGLRELKEELNADNFKPVASFKNLFRYKFPCKGGQRGHKGQKQSLFIAEFTGLDSDIRVNFWEHRSFAWVEADRLVEAVHPIRQPAAKIFMEKFWQTVRLSENCRHSCGL